MIELFRFAHISDIHLGAFRDSVIRELERQALAETVKKCIELKVDFVLISGDLFHVSIPDILGCQRCNTNASFAEGSRDSQST